MVANRNALYYFLVRLWKFCICFYKDNEIIPPHAGHQEFQRLSDDRAATPRP